MKKWQNAVAVLVMLAVTVVFFASYVTMNSPDTSLTTEDGKKISYDYHHVSDKGVILLHMMDRNKDDYKELAALLNKNGYSTIAIDFRGHGKSTGNWKDFKDKDFQDMILDIKAAKNFLVERGVNKITILGASIGANLALNYSAQSDIKRLILLSPGEDYHTIKVFESLSNYNGSLLIIAAKDDPEAYSTSEKINREFSGNSKFISYDTGGHGTYIFLVHPELKETILEFLNNN